MPIAAWSTKRRVSTAISANRRPAGNLGSEDRQPPRLAQHIGSNRGFARYPVGIFLVAGPCHAAGLVRIRLGGARGRHGYCSARLHETSPFFRTTISNMEMVLAKSSLAIARALFRTCRGQGVGRDGVCAHRRRMARDGRCGACHHRPNGSSRTSPRLSNSIRLRLPYIDALNHLQVDLLRRRRAGDQSEGTLRALHMSINGVSAGLRNSG